MLLLIFGPPAVGKMTVGRAVCARSDFRLFHNHMTIEPLLETFGFGTAPFNTLNSEFRRRVLEEAAANGIDLVFTLVIALDLEEDRRVLESYAEIFGDHVAFVELRASLETRLERNHTAERLAAKASKRDLAWSDANVRELERFQMSTLNGAGVAADLLARHPHLVVETDGRTADDVAETILTWLAGVAV